MKRTIATLFNNSNQASSAIDELKKQGFTKDISVVSRDINESNIDKSTNRIKMDNTGKTTTAGATSGAAAGAIVGGLAAVITGTTAAVIPGGMVIAGPLAAAVLGAATGAVTGGLVGWLTDRGIPDERAKMYEDKIKNGQTLVTVTVDESRVDDVMNTLRNSGVDTNQVEQYSAM